MDYKEKEAELEKNGRDGNKGERGRDGTDGIGIKGERGRDAISVKLEESFYLLPSQLSQQQKKRNGEELYLPIFRVKEGGKLRKLSQNRELSDDIVKVSKHCPSELKLLNGYCKWHILQFVVKKSWCFAEDFQVDNGTCSDCIISLETKIVDFEGAKRKVVTEITYSDQLKQQKSYPLSERSCKLLDTSALEKKDFRKCGFFCFYHNLEPIFENNSRFSCQYAPPSYYGMKMSSPTSSNFDLSNKLEMISIEIVCS